VKKEICGRLSPVTGQTLVSNKENIRYIAVSFAKRILEVITGKDITANKSEFNVNLI
jgi:hypothetical protein